MIHHTPLPKPPAETISRKSLTVFCIAIETQTVLG